MQKTVKDFNDNKGAHTKPMPVYARILDIQSELGELAKEYLKHSKYGTTEFELDEEFKMEFGDILYSLLSLSNELEIDSKLYLNKVINKYTDRINKNKSMGSGR
jgi:NTP pyrophosphatase (non-canonical NTP hydrolase)